jgi:hypothetical protein
MAFFTIEDRVQNHTQHEDKTCGKAPIGAQGDDSEQYPNF